MFSLTLPNSSVPLCLGQPWVFPQQSPSNRPMIALATNNAIKASKALLSPVTSLTSLTRKILVIQISLGYEALPAYVVM